MTAIESSIDESILPKFACNADGLIATFAEPHDTGERTSFFKAAGMTWHDATFTAGATS